MQNKNFKMVEILKAKLSFNRNPKLFLMFNSNLWQEEYQNILMQICHQDPPKLETMNTIIHEGHTVLTLYMKIFLEGH